jgi:hypothetical protein
LLLGLILPEGTVRFYQIAGNLLAKLIFHGMPPSPIWGRRAYRIVGSSDLINHIMGI